MKKLSTHGDFPVDAIEKAKHELVGELDFAEQAEPLPRNGAGFPSLGGFLETHFNFGEEPVSNFYTSDLRRLRDALRIAENNIGKGYSYGSHQRVAELRAQLRDLLGQHYRNLAAAQQAAGDPNGKPDNCCTGEPGHGPTGIKVHTDNRGALIPEYREEEPEWSKPLYDAMQKAAALNEEILSHYAKYEHEVRMMRYGAADTHFAAIRTLSEDFRNAYPVKDFQWDKDLRALEIKMHDAPSYEARLPLQDAYMKLQNRYYKDFKGMPWPDMAAQGYVPTYSESGDVAPFDFARCQRPDGSIYGTSGQCRKGSPTGAKEKEAPKGRAAKSDSPRSEPKAKVTKTRASGNTKATSATPKGSMNKADRARAEKAAAGRKVAADMKPKVKELDRRAKDLNKEANRLEKAFRAQQKVVQKNPTKENKARLKLIQQETRMADRAAKQADKAADKASAQMEKAMRKAMS